MPFCWWNIQWNKWTIMSKSFLFQVHTNNVSKLYGWLIICMIIDYYLHCGRINFRCRKYWQKEIRFLWVKYVPHRVPPIYLLMKHSHSSGSEYFSRCFDMMSALIWIHFEVNFYISKPFGFSNIRRRWNGATSFGPLVFDFDFIILDNC